MIAAHAQCARRRQRVRGIRDIVRRPAAQVNDQNAALLLFGRQDASAEQSPLKVVSATSSGMLRTTLMVFRTWAGGMNNQHVERQGGGLKSLRPPDRSPST